MIKFFLKLGVGFNLLSLSHGYLNSKINNKQKDELALKETKNKFNFVEINENFESFKQNHPQFIDFPESNRQESIKKLQNQKLDILIIGGGCSGAGVLLESHRRGLKTGLIEINDFASGTSSRSTKLIHGGIRYLHDTFSLTESNRWEKFKLVFEALNERDFLINSLPFMNNTVEIKIPYTNFFKLFYYYTGVYFYQMIYFLNNFPNVFNSFPWPRINLKEKTVSFFEGQMFDSRQCLLTILTCTRLSNINNTNAICANYVEFVEYIYDNDTGKIKGIKSYDKINKKYFTILADCVVNCTGVFADRNLNKQDKYVDKLIRASKGAHLILDKKYVEDKFRINSGFMLPNTTDGRVLFILPYQNDYYIIGTTDTEKDKTFTPDVDDNDVDYLKKELKLAFKLDEKELEKEIKSKWSGLRPLVLVPRDTEGPSEGMNTKSMARNHVIRVDNETGLVSLMGGKWTTYRRMGRDVLDRIKADPQFKTITDKMKKAKEISKLTGAIHWKNIDEDTYFSNERKFFYEFNLYLIDKFSISKDIVKDLVFRYGLNAEKILEINSKIKETDKYILAGKDSCPILMAELIYCIKYEMVIKPNDFICRRNGIAFVDYEKSLEILDQVTNIIGKQLNWGRDRIKSEKQEALINLKYFL